MNRADPGTASDPDAPYVRVAVAGIVQRPGAGEEDRWLLLQRSQPRECWDPPGGRLERFEDLSQGVRREIREETGLTIAADAPCYAYLTYYKGERLIAVSMACRVDPEGRDIDDLRLEPGITGWEWATAREWEDLGRRGLSSWKAADVRRVTRLAAELWEAHEE